MGCGSKGDQKPPPSIAERLAGIIEEPKRLDAELRVADRDPRQGRKALPR
jgi:hypothetical protein